ncbi:12688_t:CDS:2 [Dentiscutata erythropus]|uniref:12688_t:CDS:1 n=1 Tax=Dentiscutata erythropus TaxID=1348616 RepID=A0A9N8Z0M7_9GLOM|nr:12688_t:CDS:2 [Dentiscutata erythropus]
MDEENIFAPFHPEEEYTTRIKNILTEYPDGSQILREILQNSDDAKSSEQIFILDHNTYPDEKLFDPRLGRYQGPALLSANNSIFQENDFKSLLNLANSAKMNDCDKIGVMGIGFNSIFHIADVCFFISGSSYVFIDPHGRGYCKAPREQRGTKTDFVNHKLAMKYPDQFMPFLTALKNNPLDEPYKGTIFRYPLRTDKDAVESKISTKKYTVEQVEKMFDTFFKVDNITCLLFLKYIEKISFYELKEGSKIPELLYEIELINAEEIRETRTSFAKNIKDKRQSEVSYQMKFYQKSTKDITEIKSEWQVINYIANINDEEYKKFNTNIRDCKFIPLVGLAARIDNISENKGRLHCFLPLPDIEEDFSISINGCFAVSKNRRNLENSINKDLAPDDPLLRKGEWNKYLFEDVIPIAWKKFLCEMKNYVSFEQIYTFWPIPPIPTEGSSENLDKKRGLWAKLLQKVVNQLDVDLKVFRGPLDYLSINNGYFFDDDKFKKSKSPDLLKLLAKLKFPVFVDIPKLIVDKLKESTLKDQMNFITPEKVCDLLKVTYMHGDSHVNINDTEKLLLSEYILGVKNVNKLYGLPLLPIKNKTFTTFKSRSNNEFNYILSEEEYELIDKNFMEKIVDNTIEKEVLSKLKDLVKENEDINLQNLPEIEFAEILNKNIMSYKVEDPVSIQEIKIKKNQIEWIYKIWDHLQKNNKNLTYFLDVYLLPIDTSKNDDFIVLRKLGAKQKCLCRSSQKIIVDGNIVQILSLLGSAFININENILNYKGLENYVIKIDEIIAVLSSLEEHSSFPSNLVQVNLTSHQRQTLTSYLGYLKKESCYLKVVPIIKYIPLFTEVNSTNIININSLIESGKNHFLLPKEDEQSYGHIVSDSVFLETHSSEDLCFLLEDVFKVQRLKQEEYWNNHVILYLSLQEPMIVDEIVKELFKRWEIINLKDELSKIKFVMTSSADKKKQKPTDIFKPDKQLKDLFYSDEPFFPDDIYRMDFPKLLELGMKELMTIDDIVNRITIYISNNVKNETREKSLLLLKYIDNNYQDLNNSDDSYKLRNKITIEKWIPVTNPDEQYSFSKALDCRDRLHATFANREMPIVDYIIINSDLRKIFGWNDYPSIDIMINQLFQLLNEFNMPKENSNMKEINDDINKIYEHLNNIVDNHIDFLKNKLSDAKWILNDAKIYSANALVFTIPNYLMGFKWSLVSKHNSNYYTKLLEKLGVKKEPETSDCLEILQSLSFKDNNKFNVINILEYLSQKKEILKGLLIPNMLNEMIPHESIFYNDINDYNNKELVKENENILTSPEISSELAKRLKIKNFSEKFVLNKINTFDTKITATFKKALKDFDREEMVFREFLKNADDAGATQFCIILDDSDYRGSRSLIKEEMDCWQGPAVWLYNNKSFTEDDFKSIINVGCNKKPDKIGKDGLGFISCYNLTDLPQFISNDRIVFFDPQRKFLPDNKHGSIFYFDDYNNDDKGHVFNMFKNQFEPYLNLNGDIFDLNFNNKEFKGALFRLPLRAASSEIYEKVYKIENIISLLESMKNDIISELIFLRNVETIKVYRKKGPQENAEILWKVEIIKNDPGRKLVGKKFQAFQIDIQFTEENYSKIDEWLICSGEKTSVSNDDPSLSDTWGGVATTISETSASGRIYSHIPLDVFTRLSMNLHSNNWALSPDRTRLDLNDAKASQNKNILEKVLPQLHVKFFEEYIKRHQKAEFQVISEFWPIPKDNDPKILQYGQKVLKLVSQGNHKIFWSPFKGGSYIDFRHCCFINKDTPINIVDFLNENEYPTVLLDPEHLEVFEKLDIKPQKTDPRLIRSILKSERLLLDSSKLDISFSLLNYILEDECYGELEGIPLVPLFDDKFGEFTRCKNYSIATQEEFKLFPNAGPDHFVSREILERRGLYEKFTNYDFRTITNIRYFTYITIRNFLCKELEEVSELEWEPNSNLIPNQEWLNKIMKCILNSTVDSTLQPFESFPLIEVYDPNNHYQHKLVSLKDAKHRPLLICSNLEDDIIKALTNIGIRFTTRQYNKKLEEYILKLEPDNILFVIEKYRCYDNLLNNKKSKKILSKYFCQDLSLLNNGIDKLKKLPIWPTHTVKSGNIIYRSILDENTYLIPKPFTFYPLNECHNFYFNTENQPNMRKLLESLSAKKQTKLPYIKAVIVSDISIPQDMRDDYLQFLIDIFSDSDSIDNIKDYIKELKVIPNKAFELCYAKDLFDQYNSLFKCVYEDSNRFPPNKLQDNQKSKEALKKIGLKHNVNSEIFIECAEEIQANFLRAEKNLIKRKKIKNAANTAVSYFYENQLVLNFSTDEWNKLSKIKFVPTTKKVLKVPYEYNCNNNSEKLQSFENLCLSKHKNLAWTQLSFFKNEPNENVLKTYPSLGLPTIPTIIKHLETIQKEITKSVEWKRHDTLLFKAIKDIYEELNSRCINTKDKEELRLCFPEDIPLILNSTNPFDSESWVIASHLDMNIQKDYSLEKRSVNEYLKVYENLLPLVGVGSMKIPNWHKDVPAKNNSQQLSESIIKFLEAGNKTMFNNVIFRVKNCEFYANSSILICAAPYFQEIFFETERMKYELTYDDIEPNSFCILLNWLYGIPLPKDINGNENTNYNNNEFFQIYDDLLLASEKFKLEQLKNLVEYELAEYVKENLVDSALIDVERLAEKYNLTSLIKYCEQEVFDCKLRILQ